MGTKLQAQDAALSRMLSSIFSDGTELFRSPAEPDPGQTVALRLRLARDADVRVTLLAGQPPVSVVMRKCRTDACFDWYEAQLVCADRPILYDFAVEWHGLRLLYQRTGARLTAEGQSPDPALSFRLIPGFHVPAWSRGAVQYQILADRFRNGDTKNDVLDGEYAYINGPVMREADWYAPPGPDDFRRFYGGDLQGVLEKLDYLQSLGVEAVYFNPIFVSPSSHGYDTQDYEHIDPHLAVIADDGGEGMARYIRRVTSDRNLARSDELFAELCQQLHRRGMRVILDGVFNHCGSFHRWLDREGVYADAPDGAPGAWRDPDSPYRRFFRFDPGGGYEGWWGHETLPKLNYEGSRALCERIFATAQRWALPPYSIDGWRLDVAADLGHSRPFNHLFWKEFRRRLKAVNPELLIVAEHYGDPAEWLTGDEWDTVMNYDAFMEPLTYFLTGMEKHSDARRDELYHNGPAFFESMLEKMSRMPTASLYCAMNELSNHDHSRFLTRTNRRVGRLESAGSAAAGEGIEPGVFRQAAVIQMTWPGAPTIYYGDEAGQVGWTDPDNRRTYPWGREDNGLIELHRRLAGLRRRFPVLRSGSVKPLAAGDGYIAYARFDGSGCAVIACNCGRSESLLSLPVRDAGAPDGAVFTRLLVTTEDGFSEESEPVGPAEDGTLPVLLPPCSAVILTLIP